MICKHGVSVWCLACWREGDITVRDRIRDLSDHPAKVAAMNDSKSVPLRCLYCNKPALQDRRRGCMCAEHAENWARTQGLIATLALPPLHCADRTERRRVVEVDIRSPLGNGSTEPVWQRVESMVVDASRIVITTADGETVTRDIADGVPPWRAE